MRSGREFLNPALSAISSGCVQTGTRTSPISFKKRCSAHVDVLVTHSTPTGGTLVEDDGGKNTYPTAVLKESEDPTWHANSLIWSRECQAKGS